MLSICLDKGVLRLSWFSLGNSAVFQHQKTWLLLCKCFKGNHLSARRWLRDRIWCSHFLVWSGCPSSTYWDCQKDEQSIGGFHGNSSVVSLTADSEQPAGQQMICFSHDNIYSAGFCWKNASGYVGDQTQLHMSRFTVCVTRLGHGNAEKDVKRVWSMA